MSHTSLVPGKTDGVAVPAGMVGEVLTFTSRTTTGVTNTWVANATPLVTLTPGVWIIYAAGGFTGANTATVIGCHVSLNTTASSAGAVAAAQHINSQNASAANTSYIPMNPVLAVNVSTSTPLYAKSFSEDSAVDVTVNGFALRIA